MFFRNILFAAVLVALSGCALVPGLHPDVQSDEEVTLFVDGQLVGSNDERFLNPGEPVNSLKGLRVVTLTPVTLTESAKAKREARWSASKILEELDLPEFYAEDAEVPATHAYKLGPGDVVSVVVWEHPELTNPAGEFRDPVSSGRTVTEDGNLYYPYAGLFRAEGLTVSELRLYLVQELAKVIESPKVDVQVVAYRSKRVQVSGEVRQPGIVTLDNTNKGILEAISERGGLSDNASRRRLVLVRDERRYELDLASLLSGDLAGKNLTLREGDVFHVPDRSADQVHVLGEVGEAGTIQLGQSPFMLTDAIAQGKGFDRNRSSDSGVLVFRRPDKRNGLATVYRLDMSEAVGVLIANEFELQAKDVVYVSASAFAKYNSIINQFLPTISAIFQIDRLTDN